MVNKKIKLEWDDDSDVDKSSENEDVQKPKEKKKVSKPKPVDIPKTIEKIPQEFRDDLIGLLTHLKILGEWERFKKGYRPGNILLWNVVEKIDEMLKKY